MKKLFGLFSTTLLATLMCVGLTNRVKEKAPETAAPRQTLEVRDVLRKGAEDGEGNVVRRNAAAPTTYGMSDAKIQVTAPNDDGRVDVRFVAGIDSFDYSNAQFTIIMHNEEGHVGSITREVTSAYMAIELEGEVKTAAEVFGEGYDYFIAYTLKGMPKTDWLNNSFEIGTGLKQAEDEEYTEHYTEEIKSVNEAVYADHLVFKFSTYNGSYITFTWENDFVLSQIAPELNSEDEDYVEKLNEIIPSKCVVTYDDGNGNTKVASNMHSNGVPNNTKSMNMLFSGLDTENSEFTITATITYATKDGEEKTITGSKKRTKLSNVENALVTPQEDDTFVLNFDSVVGAEEYTYKIYNDTYEGQETKIVSGGTLETAALSTGVYNLEITASSNYYIPSTIVLEQAFEVTKEAEILDGTGVFTLDIIHSGTAYEHKLEIRPNDSKDAVTISHKVSEFVVTRIDCNTLSREERTRNAGTNSYNSSKDAYVIDFGIGQTPNLAAAYYEVSFIIQTDAGTLYQVVFYYFAEDSITMEYNTHGEALSYVLEQKFANTYGSNEKALDAYNEGLEKLANASNDEAINVYSETLNNIEKAIYGVSKLLDWDTTYAVDSDGANDGLQAVDGNTDSRWESTHSEPHYLIVRLTEVSLINKLEISWETASAKTYYVYVSETGEDETWTLVYQFNPTGSNVDKMRVDTLQFEDSYNAQYIKIYCLTRTTGYGFSIFEMYAYGGPAA